MARQAIIHIGTPKTGSTSIQQVLKLHRDDLPAQGAAFLRSPGGGAAIQAFLTFSAVGGNYRPADPLWAGMDPEQRLAQFRTEFAAEMAELPASVDRVIFSDEKLSMLLRHPGQFLRLRELLDPYFDRYAIVAYLRRQDSLMASDYTQLLRVGMVMETDAVADFNAKLHHYNYGPMLAMWADAFGDAAVNARIYERTEAGDFDSVGDFLAVTRLSLTLTEADRARTLNPSINLAGQTLLRDVARLMVEKNGRKSLLGPAWRAITIGTTAAVPGKGWAPTRTEAMAFMARFAEGNEELRRRFRPDRASLFNGDFSHLPETARQTSLEENYQAACMALVEAMGVRLERDKKAERAAARRAALGN